MSTAPLPSAWHCQRCSYDWYGRRGWGYADGAPSKCPRCKDPGWNHARKYRARVPGGRRRAEQLLAKLIGPPDVFPEEPTVNPMPAVELLREEARSRRRAGMPPLHLPPTIPPTPLPPPEPALDLRPDKPAGSQEAPGDTQASPLAPEPSQLALAPPAGAEGARRYLLTSPQATAYLWAHEGVIVASDLSRLVGMRLAALPASWLERA